MKSPLTKLNLRPSEKRFLVGTLAVTFIVLNIWFVWPHFGAWTVNSSRYTESEQKLKNYQSEIAQHSAHASKLKKLQETGSDILSEQLQLQRIIQSQAAKYGVMVTRYDPRSRQAAVKNNFFEEQVLSIDCTSGSKELVDFLVTVASGNSMIRVREMSLRPDTSQTKLLASVTFVASYQKPAAAPAPSKSTNSAKLTAQKP